MQATAFHFNTEKYGGSKTSFQETAICLFLLIKMKSDNSYVADFVNQVKGKGYSQLGDSLTGFQGTRMQKGFGLGSLLREFYCTALPFAKTGAKSLGTASLHTGANIMKDEAKGRNFRKSVEKRGEQGGLELLNKVKAQMDRVQNRKRKCVMKDSDHSRSKQRKISNETKGIKVIPAFKVIQAQSIQVYRDIFS